MEKEGSSGKDVPSSTSLPTVLQATVRVHKGPVHVARFNTLGRYLLTAGSDRQIHLFNAATLSQGRSDGHPAAATAAIKTYAAHSGSILALSIASDNATFVSGGEDRNVLQWDVASGSVLRRLSAHSGAIHTVMYCGAAKDGANDVLATAGFDGTLRFYDMRARGAWKPIMECKDAKDAILCAATHEALIWTGSVDGVIRTYDMRAGELREDTVDRPVTSISPSSTGTSLLVSTLAAEAQPGSGRDGQSATHIILDNADGSHLQTMQGGPNKQYRCRATLWNSDATVVAGDERGQLAAWDVLSGERIPGRSVEAWSRAHDKAVLWTECSERDGGRMVTASADSTVKLWGTAAIL